MASTSTTTATDTEMIRSSMKSRQLRCGCVPMAVTRQFCRRVLTGGSNIYLFDPQEGSYRAMSKTKPEVGEWALDPSLSLDGNHMAYIWRSGFRDKSSSRLLVLNRADQTTLEVTPAKNVDDAAILPDATGIVYSPNEREIHLVKLDTMTSKLVYAFEESPDPVMDGLSISQNGQHIAFSYGPDGLASSEIYRLSITGDQLDRLTNNGVPDLRPAWAPDNRRIAFNRMLSPDLDWNDIIVIDSNGGKESTLTNSLERLDMSQFEIIAITLSSIVGSGVAQLLGSFSEAVRSRVDLSSPWMPFA